MARLPQIRTEDVQQGQNLGAEITATGDAELLREPIEVVNPADMVRIAENEKFMNEFVTIMIEEDDSPDAPRFIQCGHQGINQYIHRGTPQRIRRKFLYSLIAGKKTTFTSTFGKDQNGEAFNRLPGTSRTTHRLQVIQDDNPDGRKAFLRWMAEA